MSTQHITAGMTRAEKIERCRTWLPGGKFLSERGSQFVPRPESTLDIWRKERVITYKRG